MPPYLISVMGDKIDRVGDQVELLVEKMDKVVHDAQAFIRFLAFDMASLFNLIFVLKENIMICLDHVGFDLHFNQMYWKMNKLLHL
jgi:hypothetical protein